MTERKLLLLVAVTAVVSVAGTYLGIRVSQGGEPPSGGRWIPLSSSVLDERRDYTVFLPQGYDDAPGARYPVLYVLDGEVQAGHTAESAALLARLGVIPPLIVVGIPNVSEDTRARDLTPPESWRAAAEGAAPASGGERFLSFLRTELIPKIEAEYRTAPPRMLAGWSRSGLFVLYSQVAAPSLFEGRLAHSPFVRSEEDERAVTHLGEGLRAAPPTGGFLFLSLGDQEKETTAPFQRAVGALEGNAPPTLRWRADVSPGGSHESNVRLSTPLALCAMFAPATGQTCRPGA
jgi:predicted alpha/beta superfamily hydrolase